MTTPASALNVDLTDPSVRRLLAPEEGSPIVDPRDPSARSARPMVQLAGDAADPTGRMAGRGLMSTHRLDTGKIEVLVAYRGKVGDYDLTVDVYTLPGQPIELHMICPKCRHKNRITAERKQVAFEEKDARPYTFVDGSSMPFNGGDLSVEPFQCGWEMPDAGEHKTGIRAGGITLCKLTLAIDHNVAKDA